MAAPSMTRDTLLIDGATVTFGNNTEAAVDISTKFEVQFSVEVVFGGSPDGNALVELFRNVATTGTPDYDTEPWDALAIPQETSTTKQAPITAPTGHWRIRVTNNDSADSITVTVKYATVDAIS